MNDSMTYKGYIGTVHYSEEDEVFHGKIAAINDLIMFEGASVVEVQRNSPLRSKRIPQLGPN